MSDNLEVEIRRLYSATEPLSQSNLAFLLLDLLCRIVEIETNLETLKLETKLENSWEKL